MAEQNGTTLAKSYNPRDHLVTIKTKEGPKEYYPAAWRLYELNLRYEEANFQSDILHMDSERDFVIIRCKLYLGPDYEMSHRKTEAMKQGRLSQLDKVETAAKARCARDLGISTELALDMLDIEEEEGTDTSHAQEGSPAPVLTTPTASTHPAKAAGNDAAKKPLDPAIVKERLTPLFTQAKKLDVCQTDKQFVAYLCKLLQLKSWNVNAITSQHLTAIAHDLKAREQQAA